MAGWRSDIRYGLRSLRRSPGFAAAAVGLLAAGIAANTAMFSAIDVLLLRPLPVQDPERLVRMVRIYDVVGARSSFFAWNYRAARDRSKYLAGVAGQSEADVAVTYAGHTERARAHLVTPEFFSILGVKALYGRVLDDSDARSIADTPATVLSYRYWAGHFAGDPRAVGRQALIQGHRFVVVGVLPREFNGISVDTAPDLRIPVASAPLVAAYPELDSPEKLDYELFGRLRPQATLQQAEAEWSALYHASDQEEARRRPAFEAESRDEIRLQPLERGVSAIRARFSGALVFLMAAVGLLLVLICANVAGLVLARASAREHEIALRAAVGASQARLIRLLLTESGVIMAAAGILGTMLAFAALPALTRLLPPVRDLGGASLPVTVQLEPDLRTLAFSLALCAATVLLFGAGPALAASRADLRPRLNAARSGGSVRGRSALVVFQAALSTALLACAGLLLATFRDLKALDPGFDRDHVVTFSVDPSLLRYTPQQARALHDRLLEQVRRLPDVRAAAFASRGLMRGTGVKMTVARPGERPSRADFLNTSLNVVSPEYFDAMGIRRVAGAALPRTGRPGIGLTDDPHEPVVVNQAFVRRFSAGGSPIGRRFGVSAIGVPAKPQFDVIGVVTDAKYRSLREPVPPTVYRPWSPEDNGQFQFEVRTGGRPNAVIGPVRNILRAIDPQLPVSEVNTLAAEVDASLWGERLLAYLASTFAAAAAIVAAAGAYALLAYAVARRRREIGIRMALGAEPAQVARTISVRAVMLTAAGAVIGTGAAAAASPWIRSLLYGIAPEDPRMLAGAAVAVIGVGALASAVPSFRAARVDPSSTLREEN